MPIRPLCKNDEHPGSDRDTMECAMEPTADRPYYVFWCRRCAEVLKVKAVQVFTAARYREEVRRQLRVEGRLPARPRPVRSISFDGSLRPT